MQTLVQGQRVKFSDIMPSPAGNIQFNLNGIGNLDLICFGLDAQRQLSDDRFMVFYNQRQSPCGGISLGSDLKSFEFDLNRLDAKINHLVFAISTDGPSNLNTLGQSSVTVGNAASIQFAGNQLNGETVLMLMEFYRKDSVWRLTPSLQGFDKGLAALVTHFGGEVSDGAQASSQQSAADLMAKFEQRIQAEAPALVDLAKKAKVSIEKHALTNVMARVGLVLDTSGSMNHQYTKGHVQELLSRMVPLALHFDDDGDLDCWAFADKTQKLSEVSTGNYKNFINEDSGGWQKWNLGSRINNEPDAIRKVIAHYQQFNDKIPTYILFVSDGGVHQNREITQLIKDSANLPIFWQFVGIGGHNYGILEHLDEMGGRVVDNCNFFAIDDLHQISESDLYDRMMNEFPQWIKDAKSKNII